LAKTKLRTVNSRPLSIDKSCKMVYNKLMDAGNGTDTVTLGDVPIFAHGS